MGDSETDTIDGGQVAKCLDQTCGLKNLGQNMAPGREPDTLSLRIQAGFAGTLKG